jgi:hypothetical protein
LLAVFTSYFLWIFFQTSLVINLRLCAMHVNLIKIPLAWQTCSIEVLLYLCTVVPG